MSAARDDLQTQIDALRAELRERRAALPAHSIRPHQLLILEELEERIAELETRLAQLD